MEARLQAVSSRNIYSLQGLLALMRPSCGQVCHSLMVVSYCRPGSALDQAARQICDHRSVAAICSTTLPVTRAVRFQVPLSSSALKKSLGTRMELLEFCPATVL